jgi:hypothetical protein
MKNENRYLIAKYAPDLQRLEPINIGVILWTPKGVGTHFVPVESVRSFIKDRNTYSRWTDHWSRLARGDSVSLYGGSAVKRSSSKFLDAILKTQKGHYLLFDAGVVTDEVRTGDVEIATKFLYDRLVNKPEYSMAGEKDRMSSLSSEALKNAGIADMPGFKNSLDVPCKVHGIKQTLQFHAGVESVEETPDLLFLRVLVRKQQSVTSSAFKFEWVTKGYKIKQERCVALVNADSDTQKIARTEMKLLGQFANVINLHDTEEAADKLAKIAA